jgi:hypothetical protein
MINQALSDMQISLTGCGSQYEFDFPWAGGLMRTDSYIAIAPFGITARREISARNNVDRMFNRLSLLYRRQSI